MLEYIIGFIIGGVIVGAVWFADSSGWISKDAIIESLYVKLKWVLGDERMVAIIEDYDKSNGTRYLPMLESAFNEIKNAMESSTLTQYIKLATTLVPRIIIVLRKLGL